jgi:hypothetical protein
MLSEEIEKDIKNIERKRKKYDNGSKRWIFETRKIILLEKYLPKIKALEDTLDAKLFLLEESEQKIKDIQKMSKEWKDIAIKNGDKVEQLQKQQVELVEALKNCIDNMFSNNIQQKAYYQNKGIETFNKILNKK